MGSTTAETGLTAEGSEATREIAQQVFVGIMEPKHIPEVCQVEQECFSSPWTEQMFRDDVEKNPLSRYFVLLDRQQPARVIAYGGYWKIFDEGHITNIAVRPAWQGKRAGRYLMEQMMAFAKAEGVCDMTLEVRRSNARAQRLYSGLGFATEGVRPKYYEDNGEDALLMWYRTEKKEV